MNARAVRFPTASLTLIVLAAVVFAWVGNLSVHAIEKHGLLAVHAAKCLDSNGPIAQFMNVQDFPEARIAHVCEDPDNGKFYILIATITGIVITAFCKDKFKKKAQLEKYMANRNYR